MLQAVALCAEYIDIRYAPANKRSFLGEVSIENIQHLARCPVFLKEVEPLWKGLALRGLIEKQGRGRKPQYTDAENFVRDAIEAHLALFNEFPEYKYSQDKIAQRMGYRDPKSWRARADQLGVDRDALKQHAL